MGNPQVEVAEKWKTMGFEQPNSMGGGEAAIPETGKFRVFILMGQSNMNGSGRAKELEAPYNQKRERIRIWANGRWEYLVPSNKFGPGVSLAHQLADFWPDDWNYQGVLWGNGNICLRKELVLRAGPTQ